MRALRVLMWLAFISCADFVSAGEIVVDLHYGIQKGTGWLPNESGGEVEVKTTSVSPPGSDLIELSDASRFVKGQLICYGDGVKLHTAVIRDIGSGQIKIDPPVSDNLDIGSSVFNFYRDDAHANGPGFGCVAAEAVRQLSGANILRAEVIKGSDSWIAENGALETYGALNPYQSISGGIAKQYITKFPGSFVYMKPVAINHASRAHTEIILNPGTSPGGNAGIVELVIRVVSPDGIELAMYRESVASMGTATVYRKIYDVVAGAKVFVSASSLTGNPFQLGRVVHSDVMSDPVPINQGKHVLLGDSWFAPGGSFHRSLAKQLTGATLINAGVPGNTSTQASARFYTDVAPHKPEFVWVVLGTNDYYQGVTTELYRYRIAQIRNQIASIGAKAIFLNAAVGAVVSDNGTSVLDISREYANSTIYQARALPFKAPFKL